MALVIFCMFFTLPIFERISFSPATFLVHIRQFVTARNSIRTLLGKPVTYGLQARHYVVVVVPRLVDFVEHVPVIRPREIMQRRLVIKHFRDIDGVEVPFVHRIRGDQLGGVC